MQINIVIANTTIAGTVKLMSPIVSWQIFGSFSDTIALTNGEVWYRKLKEAIEKSQLEKVWMSETKVPPLGTLNNFIQFLYIFISLMLDLAKSAHILSFRTVLFLAYTVSYLPYLIFPCHVLLYMPYMH